MSEKLTPWDINVTEEEIDTALQRGVDALIQLARPGEVVDVQVTRDEMMALEMVRKTVVHLYKRGELRHTLDHSILDVTDSMDQCLVCSFIRIDTGDGFRG